MKPNVYVTRMIPEDILAKIQKNCEVKVWAEADIPVPREILEKEIQEVEGLFCLLTESIDDALLAKAKHLKIISNMAVGYNNIDVKAATRRGIMVANTPGVLTETTADLTFALLMMTARRMEESSHFLRKGEWTTWSPMLFAGQDIYGSTLGIVGMGRIGEALAKRAKGFDMKLLYHNRHRKYDIEKALGVEYRSLEKLLMESDFVCIMTPYSSETHNLIGEKEFNKMKSTGILINTARGGIVNEEALYDALVNGKIWAAGLDVFASEPIQADHPLLTLPNLVALPHIGSATIKTRRKMADLAAENLVQALIHEHPIHWVNPHVKI